MQSKLITNRKRAKQLLAFDELKWGKCSCTDIDISLDFQGKCFVFGEIKGYGVALTAGQKYHLQGLVKAIKKGGLSAFAFLAHHTQSDTELDVPVASCKVVSVYNGTHWEEYQGTVNQFITEVHGAYEIGKML